MRMLVVQLPNFGPVASAPVQSGWSELREEQRKAVAADANAALIPTIDVGERNNLHPGDKIDIGVRLAMAGAGADLPMPIGAKREGGAIVVRFSGVDGGLQTWSGSVPIGLELCAETLETCRYALASVAGDSLTTADDGKPATRIRYAWAESPVVNTYDARQIPLPTFEIPIGD
jgi:sialate O-acetylesterase